MLSFCILVNLKKIAIFDYGSNLMGIIVCPQKQQLLISSYTDGADKLSRNVGNELPI
jgi:hypothetical protein